MGWRISLYRVPKKTVEKYKNFTQEDYNKNPDEIFDVLEKDRIKYDTLTDIIGFCSAEDKDKFSSKLFNNKLNIEEDMYFGTISKEQFLNIIEEVRVNHIIEWFDGRRIDSPDKLGDAWNNKERPVYAPKYNNMFEPWTYENAMQANQGEWNIKADRWKYKWTNRETGKEHYLNINLDLDNKWEISGGYTYEYLIFDLIHILKIFDWENDYLVAIGG